VVTRQLARSPYLAGDAFTAADISVTYALEFAQRTGAAALGKPEPANIARTRGREAYKRAMEPPVQSLCAPLANSPRARAISARAPAPEGIRPTEVSDVWI
jgi:glutathione S-transferase